MDLTILSVISTFIECCSSDLQEGDIGIVEKIIWIFKRLMRRDESIMKFIMPPLMQLFYSAPQSLYSSESNRVGEKLIYEIILQMNSEDEKTRIMACTFLLLLLQHNFREEQNLHSMKTKITVCVAKIVGDYNYQDISKLCESLEGLSESCREQNDDNPFHDHMLDTLEHVSTLISDAQRIEEHSHNKEILVELYYSISVSLLNSPVLRVTWIDNLATLHKSEGNFLESAQCKMHIASLFIQYLKWKNKLTRLPSNFGDFESVSPNMAMEPKLEFYDTVSAEQWTVKELVTKLKDAIGLFIKGNQYELAVRVHTLLNNIYEHEKSYEAMMTNLMDNHALCASLIDKKNPVERYEIQYYRVKFYGVNFPEIHEKGYIYYRVHSNLAKMKDYIQSSLQEKYGDIVEMLLSNEEHLDIDGLDKEKIYVQITGVIVYVPPEEADTRVGSFEQNFNINKFAFETVFNPDGGKVQEDELARQYKKKLIFVTSQSFPYITTRVPLIDEYTVILSPIENAIEVITRQTSKIRAEVSHVPTRINQLQQAIQGSVVPMVNPGPLRICEIFLDRDKIRSGEYDKKDVRQLAHTFDTFLKFCGVAIRLNSIKMEPKHIKFHEMVENSMADLSEIIEKKIQEALDCT
eukprot:TRINITY_DN6008_c0_g4_i1.p1 TRINITY_DN6008_c0_g4~~TRINITY_DN6008_c0_g4_i1.p1  ORF type:complete len:702 (+),score=134.73 TRINITY_DN6008_c0_g4_i1:207-2108(+)